MPLEHINQIIAYVDCTKNIFELDLFDLQFITVVFFIKCIFMTTVVKTMVEERRAFSFSFFFCLFVCFCSCYCYFVILIVNGDSLDFN